MSFLCFDKTGNGKLNCEEFAAVMRYQMWKSGQNIGDEEIALIRTKLDINNSGEVELREYTEMTLNGINLLKKQFVNPEAK